MADLPLPTSILDSILSFQLIVAWAGEGGETGRLNWWGSSLTDEAEGGDFLGRALPTTARWAGLECARKAAHFVDERLRTSQLDRPDAARTIFFLGFAMDEALDERLRAIKLAGGAPVDMPFLDLINHSPFDRGKFAQFCKSLSGAPLIKRGPIGREITGLHPKSPRDLIERLVAALVPVPEAYPLPFYRVAA
jgi:hypothetical protein